MCKSTNTITQREQFNFIEAVRPQFSWLSTYGFHCVREESTFVRYESNTSFLNIYHGRSSYEVDAEYGELSDSQSYPVYALIRLSDPKEAENYRSYTAITPDAVMAGVKKLSTILKKYAESFLNDAPNIFGKLAKQQKECAKELALEVLSKQVRPKAEEAFRNKNYVEAAKLYESIESELSTSECKKLEYARKHL